MSDSVSAPTRWLASAPDPAALPEPGGPPPEAPSPVPQLPAAAAAPSSSAPRRQHALQPSGPAALPLGPPAAAPPPWAAGRRTERTISPRAVGQVSHEFGGHLLGFSTLAVSLGAIVGTRYGGMYGGAAGALVGGAVVNVYRAIRFAMEGTPAADREAIVSGTYALAAAGFGGAVIWKVDRTRRARPNPPAAAGNGGRNCGFRPTGL